MIEYKKGDIFSERSRNRIIVHATNCFGVWGAGIALEFANRYPEAYRRYNSLCHIYRKNMLGRGIVIEGDKDLIGCVFTSFGYGKKKDSKKQILENTKKAVTDLLINAQVSLSHNIEIHSPQINSGLFGVPWPETEKIINECLKVYPEIKWVVWCKE